MFRFLLRFILVVVAANGGFARGKVATVKAPDGGIQPQAVVGADGKVHLIYYKGDAAAGDLYYVHQKQGEDRFSTALRVNSQPGSAIAAGAVRGGQLALGKNGRVHVAWNGSGKAKGKTGSAMLYARLNDAGSGFDEQQNLMRITALLDGGGTVGAGDAGDVNVAWHAVKSDGERGEEHRQVWVARSTDGGKTFAEESPAWAEATGACACCSMRAFVDRKGTLDILYRSANADVNRDIYLLSSTDRGKSFQGVLLHPWNVSG